MRPQTVGRRQLVKTVGSGGLRTFLYRCVFFFLVFQLGREVGGRSFALSPPLFLPIAWRSLPSFFLRSFRVMTPSSFIIYSFPRFSRDENGTFQPCCISPFGERQVFRISDFRVIKIIIIECEYTYANRHKRVIFL